MSLYVLADPHLSFSVNKPMDIFGGAWHGYVDALRENLGILTEEKIATEYYTVMRESAHKADMSQFR